VLSYFFSLLGRPAAAFPASLAITTWAGKELYPALHEIGRFLLLKFGSARIPGSVWVRMTDCYCYGDEHEIQIVLRTTDACG
jgi:hypothetical protein